MTISGEPDYGRSPKEIFWNVDLDKMKRSFSSFDILPNNDKCVICCKITTVPVLYQKSLAVPFGFPQPGVVPFPIVFGIGKLHELNCIFFFCRLLWWVYPKLPQARLDLLLKVLCPLHLVRT